MADSAPALSALNEVASRLREGGIVFALGGSALLTYHGGDFEIRDWDLTTDAEPAIVEALVQGLSYENISGQGLYATKCLYKIRIAETWVDLMCGFAIREKDGSIFEVPTKICGEWNGLPVGCPEAWSRAYYLIGRPVKAEFLRIKVETSGRSNM